MNGVDSDGVDQVDALRRGISARLDFLDWIRLLMVVAVVYAHTALSGLRVGDGLDAAWLIDDTTLYQDAPEYPLNLASRGGPAMELAGPAPRSVRWISIVRQWCLPLLFWVSGAAVACSYKGGWPRGMLKLLAFSAVGIVSNAGLWFLSPQRSDCIIGTADCVGKGVLFDFSICGRAGPVFAIMFQMWYTLILWGFILFSTPMFAVLHGSAHSLVLGVQWFLNTGFVSFLLFVGSECPDRSLAIGCFGLLEGLFLCCVALDASWRHLSPKTALVPVRLLHYALGGLTVLQFCMVPLAREMKHVGPEYICYLFVGFNKFFCMGYIMTHDRRAGPNGKDMALPLISTMWPISLFLLVSVAPSTNWNVAGMLTYPYFSLPVDRCLYVAGALVLTFVLDRISRTLRCAPLPTTLSRASLALYLLHPWFITSLLALGLRSVMHIWIVSMGAAVGVVYPAELVHKAWVDRSQRSKLPLDWDNMSPGTSFCGSPTTLLPSESCSDSDGGCGSSSESARGGAA